MRADLDTSLAALRKTFSDKRDKYAAHEAARPILQQLASSPEAFGEILRRHLQTADAFDRMHYPVVSLEIETNRHFGLVANCWIPLPNRDTDMSTKAIHHHGSMLLTTVTSF